MSLLIWQYIYFLLPAGFANMAPVLTKKIFKSLAIPIDYYKKFRGRYIFGPHKTIRGLLFGIVFSIIIISMQRFLYNYDFFRSISLINYSENFLLLGFLMGFGAISGDLIESFFKRRLNIKSGAKFIPFDQIDWILGMILFTFFLYTYTLQMIISLVIIAFVLHIIVRYIGYVMKMNKGKW